MSGIRGYDKQKKFEVDIKKVYVKKSDLRKLIKQYPDVIPTEEIDRLIRGAITSLKEEP